MLRAGSSRTREIARLGGLASAAARRGNSAWGRSMLGKLLAKKMHAAYPGFARQWGRVACAKARGLPPPPNPDGADLPRHPVVTAAVARSRNWKRQRDERDMARRRRLYNAAQP